MLKRTLVSLVIVATPAMLFNTAAMAAKPTAQPAKQVKQNQETMLLLRTKPSATAKVLARFPVDAPLVGFFQKGDWAKAGDPKTGQVGWYNQKQVAAAFASNQKKIETIQLKKPVLHELFISSTQQGNKPAKITVYRDGKKLSQKQADAVYKKAQANFIKEQNLWQASWHRQLKQMSTMIHAMENDNGPAMPMMVPVIVEQEPAKPVNCNKKAEKQEAKKQ
jgi:hypothetical protein